MRDLVRSLTEVDCLIADLNNAAGDADERRARIEKELAEVEKRIGTVEAELAEVEPEWSERVREEKQEKILCVITLSVHLSVLRDLHLTSFHEHRLDTTKARLDALFAKQSRTSQFRNQAQRDAFINTELQNIARYEDDQARTRENIAEQLAEARRQLADLNETNEDKRRDLEDRKDKIKEWAGELQELKGEESKLIEQRK